MTVEDTLKGIDDMGKMLEKKLGKKRFNAAIKGIELEGKWSND